MKSICLTVPGVLGYLMVLPPAFSVIPVNMEIPSENNAVFFFFCLFLFCDPFLCRVSARSWLEAMKVKRNKNVTQGHGWTWLYLAVLINFF